MKSKLAGYQPLRDLVQQAINENVEKSAALAAPMNRVSDFLRPKHASAESGLDFRDPEHMDKLASALEEVGEKIANSPGVPGAGSGGGEVLAVAAPVGGIQAAKKDKATAPHLVASDQGKTSKHPDGAGGAGTLMGDNMGMGVKPAYPAKGVLKKASADLLEQLRAKTAAEESEKEKQAFSFTQAGHKLDAKTYGALAKANHEAGKEIGDAEEEYSKENPKKGWWLHGKKTDKHGTETRELAKTEARHNDYAAKKHEQGKNAYNPFGGMRTPSRLEESEKTSAVDFVLGAIEKDAEDAKVGLLKRVGDAAKKVGGHAKDIATAKQLRGGISGLKNHAKNVAEDVRYMGRGAAQFPHNVEAKKKALGDVLRGGAKTVGAYGTAAGATVLAGKKAFGKKKEAPAAPAEESKTAAAGGAATEKAMGGMTLDSPAGSGPKPPSNPGSKVVHSIQSIIDATKRALKFPRKAELAQVLTEPAFSAAHDSKVQDNLRNATQGGVKIAVAKTLLHKIAEEGCKCDGKGECQYCKLKAKVDAKKAEK